MSSIRHIEFWVSDLKKSMDFYEKILTPLEWKQIDANGFAKDGTKIYFLEVKDAADGKTFGPRHICFEASSKEIVDSSAETFLKEGNILHGPAVLHPNGSYMLVFKDPDGYILEVAYKE